MKSFQENFPKTDMQDTDNLLMNMQNANKKTILFLGDENLLRLVSRILLNLEKNWKVMRISNPLPPRQMSRSLKSMAPSVVILYQNDKTGAVQSAEKLMRHCTELKVITVNPNDNSVEVCIKRRVWINNVDDLLSLVEA